MNAYNIQAYGKRAKQANYGPLHVKELSLYDDEDIDRPTWQLNYVGLVKLLDA
jgi:hypothetical protein